MCDLVAGGAFSGAPWLRWVPSQVYYHLQEVVCRKSIMV